MPLIVTAVPPAVGPLSGLIRVTVGGAAARSLRQHDIVAVAAGDTKS